VTGLLWVLGVMILVLQAGSLVYLWRVAILLQAIQGSLQVWERPEHLVSPAPEPGTRWAPTDAEVAAIERQLTSESQQRTPVRSRRGLGRSLSNWGPRTG
jgi:hypothetical protein